MKKKLILHFFKLTQSRKCAIDSPGTVPKTAPAAEKQATTTAAQPGAQNRSKNIYFSIKIRDKKKSSLLRSS